MSNKTNYYNKFSQGKRHEVRHTVAVGGLSNIKEIPGFRKVDYKFPYVTTVYFGCVDKKTKKPKLFRDLKIRARFYSNRLQKEYFIINDNQQCLLEIKTDKRFNKISIKNKARCGEVTKDSHIVNALSFQQITEALYDPDKLSEITANSKYEALNLILEAFQSRKINQLRPLGATNYKRTHFISKTERVTHDQNIKFFLTVQDDIGKANNIFYEIDTPKYEVIEVKKELGSDLKSTFIDHFKVLGYKITKIKDGKGTKLRKIMKQSKRKVIHFPSSVAAGSKEWDWAENETKIDLSNQDPREFVENFNPGSSWLVGNMKHEIKYLRFYLTPDEKDSVCQMSKSQKPKSKSKLKIKRFLYIKNNSLVRSERVSVFTPQALSNILKFLHINPDQKVISPIIYEYRVYKYLFNTLSGNIFRIYGDHCMVPGKDFSPLDQIEIESMGSLLLMNKKTNASIAIDQNNLSKIIIKSLGSVIKTFPGITKSLWIKRQMGYK